MQRAGGEDDGGAVGEASGLRSNRDFRTVLAGQAVSALGDAVSITAMPLLVLALTGSGALMAAVGALQLVPDLLLGLPVGALADRWDRRRMMQVSDAGRAVLTALIPLTHWLDGPTMPVILVLAMPINVLRLTSDAAFGSAVPALVGRENLTRANSYLEATLSVPFIIGPAIAGVLIGAIGAAPVLAIDAASFAVSAVSLSFVRRSLRADRSADASGAKGDDSGGGGGGGRASSLLADIKEGLRFVWAHAALRALIAYWSVIAVATAAVVPTLGYALTVDHDFGATLFGFVGSAWSVGYLGGSLAAGRFRSPLVGRRLLAGGATIGVLLVAMAVAPVPAVYLVAAFGVGAALALLLVSYLTARASLTPDALLGRVGSTARMLALALRPLSLLAAGALIEAGGSGAALAAMGGASVAAAAVFTLSRSFRTAAIAPEPGP